MSYSQKDIFKEDHMKMDKNKGKGAEDLACSYLKDKGYEIIERNYRESVGEIDIICLKDDYIVFVEVKARFDDSFGAPSDYVTSSKIRKIRMTTDIYLQKHFEYEDLQVRFDVIEIYLNDCTINHYEDAF